MFKRPMKRNPVTHRLEPDYESPYGIFVTIAKLAGIVAMVVYVGFSIYVGAGPARSSEIQRLERQIAEKCR